MRDAHSVTATIQPLGIVLDVDSFDFELDENVAPYAEARFTCGMLGAVDRAAVDMRAGDLRVEFTVRRDYGRTWAVAVLTAAYGSVVAAVTAAMGGGPVSTITNLFYRPWNGAVVRASDVINATLYMVEREFDDAKRELQIISRSDEARLIGDALLTAGNFDPASTSIREICRQVLLRYGAVLQPGAVDATVAQPAATIWKPGVTAWKYLDPMLEAASLRLWCNEAGLWYLTARQPAVDGSVTISTANTLTGNRDRMTLDPDVWYDGVAVEYRWVDALGVSQVAYDVAGPQPAKSVLHLVKDNVVYPGPGAAAGILSRGAGRGRVLDVEAVSDYTIRPGMTATIAPPDTLAQNGYLSSVAWAIPAAEMEVGTRGLIDTPVDAYIYGADSVTCNSVAAGANPDITCDTFDWSLV